MNVFNSTTWLNVAMFVALGVVLFMGATTYINTIEVERAADFIVDAYAIREATRDVVKSANEMETGQRGFLLTGDETFLEPYHAAEDRADAEIEHLRYLVEDLPEQRTRVEKLHTLLADLETELKGAIELNRKNASLEKSHQHEKEIMDDIREEVRAVLDFEAAAITWRERESRARLVNSQSFLLLGNGVAVVLLLTSMLVARSHRLSRDRAETQLRIDQAELASVIDSARDGIIAVNHDLTIRLINPSAAKSMGTTSEEAQGRSFLDWVPPNQRAIVATGMQEFLNHNDSAQAVQGGSCVRSDGTEFPYQGTLAKSSAGGDNFMTLIFRDLSETRAREEKIREQREILNQVRDTIIVCDMQDVITFWSAGAETSYGIPQEDAIGRKFDEVMTIRHAEENDVWKIGRQELLERGVFTTQIAERNRQGQQVQVEHRRSLIRDEGGAPFAQLIIQFDVTDRVAEEERLRRSQRLQSIGTLAGGIAHDLNNVLTPIMMSARLIKRSKDNVDRLAETIDAAAQRGSQMIQKLLAFAGGQHPERKQVSIHDIIQEAAGILEHTLPKSIEVQVALNDDLALVSGDATELSQVLMNLAINSRDAMPDGGRLTLAADNFPVRSETISGDQSLSPGDYVRVMVTDTGSGIPPVILDRIFDPFFTTKEQGRGTGLGLATTLGIVRSHGGDIQVFSREGEGTTFQIFLPVAVSPTIPVEIPTDVDVPEGHGESILMVDDEALMLQTAEIILTNANYVVTTAPSGTDAIELCRAAQQPFDLVVVDMMMPGINGQETAKGIRAIFPKIPVIASSGLWRPENVPREELEMDQFLPKPYTDEQLLRIVRETLDRIKPI
ncbi:PAS domain S-box protein [Bremerella cremea]|uniref:histidine kinase n=1 Tax=Bremerella cremea TaxID=1031537 RepID=A0A368KU49_9BACT|nr:PAS domain S-box protein [Bremerella cremea]RCS53909.1 PAS domain S-box protein [Bremerella cremea]